MTQFVVTASGGRNLGYPYQPEWAGVTAPPSVRRLLPTH